MKVTVPVPVPVPLPLIVPSFVSLRTCAATAVLAAEPANLIFRSTFYPLQNSAVASRRTVTVVVVVVVVASIFVSLLTKTRK